MAAITEENLERLNFAFGYYIFNELDEIFHTHDITHHNKLVNESLAPIIADTSKERISEVICTGFIVENPNQLTDSYNNMISDNRYSSETFEDQLIKGYLWAVIIVFGEQGNKILHSNPKSKKEVRELASEIYKEHFCKFISI